MAYASTRQEEVSEVNGPSFQVAPYIFSLSLLLRIGDVSVSAVGMPQPGRVKRAQLSRARSWSTGIVPTISLPFQ